MIRIAIASDHGGYQLKKYLIENLPQNEIVLLDFGTDSEQSCDYPDYAQKAALAVVHGQAEAALVICTTGNGMNIAANKIQGIRSALCTNTYLAEMARKHNHANALALGAKNQSPQEALQIVLAFIHTEFEGGRHLRRVKKIEPAAASI